MKNIILSTIFVFTAIGALAGNQPTLKAPADTAKLLYDGKNTYYQKVVMVDTITEASIYLSAIEFMASKNFTQNYGDQEEGKLIFTTSQDLNMSGYDATQSNLYSVQFAIVLDMKNGRYRYTINSATFFYNNIRWTLFDIYAAAYNVQSKVNARFGKAVLASFNTYLSSVLTEMNQDITHKSVTSNSKF
jgi:hypothetical protein